VDSRVKVIQLRVHGANIRNVVATVDMTFQSLAAHQRRTNRTKTVEEEVGFEVAGGPNKHTGHAAGW